MCSNGNSPDFQVYSWEWVPGQTIEPGVEIATNKYCTTIIFANYRSSGEHRMIVEGKKPYRIEFKRTDFEVIPLEKPRKHEAKQEPLAETPES